MLQLTQHNGCLAVVCECLNQMTTRSQRTRMPHQAKGLSALASAMRLKLMSPPALAMNLCTTGTQSCTQTRRHMDLESMFDV